MELSQIPNIKFAGGSNFFLLSGPCAIEGEDMALRIAERIVSITDKLEIPYVFKGSFKKANRSRVDSFTGIGDEKALKILRKVSETFNIPTVTDIHEVTDAAMAADAQAGQCLAASSPPLASSASAAVRRWYPSPSSSVWAMASSSSARSAR